MTDSPGGMSGGEKERDGTAAAGAAKAVQVEHLSVQYPQIKALDDINFAIDEGDFLGIIGPNGAGKSTLFASMLGLHTGYEGTIRFFGTDIRRSRDYLGKVGYVPQKPVFERNFPATVKEVVRMGLRNRGDHGDRIDKILQQLWIHELGDRRLGELSGGQQQRVFIAKALVHGPRLLILDEPVTGIDQQSMDLFYSILRDLNSAHGITIIWSSHNLDAVSQMANSVACLNRTLFFHGKSETFFADDALVKQYSEASMQEHMHQH